MKRLLWLVILVIFLISGCAKDYKIMTESIEKSVAFDFDNSKESIPDDLINDLSNYKLLLMGEIHYVKEHQEFMGTLLTALHEKGFRYYLQEVGSANSVLIDYYIKGKIEVLPELYLNTDKSLIKILYDFNKGLREEDREDEQISYIGFDMNHFSGAYFTTITILSDLYNSADLKAYISKMNDNGNDIEGFKALLVDFLNSTNDNDMDITDEQRDKLNWMTQNELDTLIIKEDWSDLERESYIENEVIRAIEKSNEEEKLIVNCGSWHAQLVPYWRLNGNVKWLGMRLTDYFAQIPEDFYSLAVTSYKGELKERIRSKNRESFRYSGINPKINLLRNFEENFGNRYVFLNYKNISDMDLSVLVEYPYDIINAPLNRQFNGLIVYPQLTVPSEFKYYE